MTNLTPYSEPARPPRPTQSHLWKWLAGVAVLCTPAQDLEERMAALVPHLAKLPQDWFTQETMASAAAAGFNGMFPGYGPILKVLEEFGGRGWQAKAAELERANDLMRLPPPPPQTKEEREGIARAMAELRRDIIGRDPHADLGRGRPAPRRYDASGAWEDDGES